MQSGHPVQIITPVVKPCDHAADVECTSSCREIHFELNETALQNVVMRDEVKDKKVCVLSIVGAFRKGKSFLLDFFLRYLHSQDESWLSEHSERIGGFKWRGGSEKETEGIWMWSEPLMVRAKPSAIAAQLSECTAHTFGGLNSASSSTVTRHSNPDNFQATNQDEQEEDICVLLMDVQGTFDSCTTIRACATIFALTAMLSSVQIYNVTHNIQEDDLQHLQVFTEYGRVALAEDADAKPFQNLVVLVRDWSYPYEAAYGFEGGAAILERRLAITERQHSELQQLRRYIRECFSSLRCFLMPHPGLQVASSPHFDGSVAQIGEEFRQELAKLIPQLVGPQNIASHTKRVGHQEILTGELLTYFQTYIGIFQTEELPQPKTMYEATAEANNQAATQLALEAYRKNMDSVCGPRCPFIAADALGMHHTEARNLSLRVFRERKKMGGPQFVQRYEARLVDEIDLLRAEYEKANESKSLTRFVRTPITLTVVMLFNQFISSFLSFLGIGIVNTLLHMFGLVLIGAIGLWTYAKYAGRFVEAATKIDELTSMLFQPAINFFRSSVSATSMRMLGNQLQMQDQQKFFDFGADSQTRNATNATEPSASNASSRGVPSAPTAYSRNFVKPPVVSVNAESKGTALLPQSASSTNQAKKQQ